MMGFFFEDGPQLPTYNINLNCGNCGLSLQPHIQPSGEGKKRILLINNLPSSKTVFGRNKQYVERVLRQNGIDFERDCLSTSMVLCPTGNLKDKHILNCRRRLYQLIEQFKPIKILTFGSAIKGLIDYKYSTGKLDKWYGQKIPDQDLGCWVFPIMGIHEVEEEIHELFFEKQIKAAIDHSGIFYSSGYKSNIHLLKEPKEIQSVLVEMSKTELTSFDYETTGLKPYNKGHKIKCVSVSDGFVSYGFMLEGVEEEWKKYLISDSKKIAQNLKFEDIWSNVILKSEVKNWYWDTMIAAHILNNCGGVTGLKFQAYTLLGIAGYDTVDEYLTGGKSANSFNTIDKCPQDPLLQYCAEDSFYTFKIYELQKNEILSQYSEAFDLFMRSTFNFSSMEQSGIRSDVQFFKLQQKIAEEKIQEVLKKLHEFPEVHPSFNPGSTQQVAEILYDKMGESWESRSTKVEALEAIGTPFCKLLLEYRKWKTNSNTFLSGFLRETSDDGNLYCNFNLNLVSSYRSSSSNVNFHNIPTRDKEIEGMTRGGLFPKREQFLREYDFKGVEVSISCCYHKDPKMIEYVLDPTTDMHRDEACNIFFREPEDFNGDPILKEERYLAKNGFIFPQFYGDYYVQNAKSIWERCSDESKKHLAENGVTSLAKLTKHMEKIEWNFWNVKFKVYNQWKEENCELYKELGYIDFYTGFRVQQIMRDNQTNNLPIQGTAFHVNLESIDYTMNRIQKWNTKMIGQVHDSQVFSVDPDEADDLDIVVGRSLGWVMQKYDWLVVPLRIEMEQAEIDSPWSTLKEVKIIDAIT